MVDKGKQMVFNTCEAVYVRNSMSSYLHIVRVALFLFRLDYIFRFLISEESYATPSRQFLENLLTPVHTVVILVTQILEDKGFKLGTRTVLLGILTILIC